MMCVCSICNTSKYLQELLNAWRRKQLKIMTDKADNSHWRGKYELTQAYKSYANYAFPNNKTCHPHCKNSANSVLCTPTNYECHWQNWKFVPRKCTACNSIPLPGVEINSSNRAPMLMFNTYMTQFTCSHHGIIIHKKSPVILIQKENLKIFYFLCKKLIQSKTPYFTHGRLYERFKMFSIQRKFGDFHKDLYILKKS